MTPNEIKVASAMSNMEYRSISQIAKVVNLSSLQVKKIVVSFCRQGLVESQTTMLTLGYRLK